MIHAKSHEPHHLRTCSTSWQHSICGTAAGNHLDSPAFQALFASYDPDRNGMLGKPEFMAMMCFLRSATQTFQSFDFQRTGTVNLNWSQWVYAAANTV